MSVLRPPLKRVVASTSVLIVGALAMLQTLGSLATSEADMEGHVEALQVALWWIAYAAVKAARTYEYKPLVPVNPVPEGKDQ